MAPVQCINESHTALYEVCHIAEAAHGIDRSKEKRKDGENVPVTNLQHEALLYALCTWLCLMSVGGNVLIY